MKGNASVPDVEMNDTTVTIHGHSRVDPYYWMRLTDEQKTAANPDPQAKKVLDYLRAENEYKEEVLEEIIATPRFNAQPSLAAFWCKP